MIIDHNHEKYRSFLTGKQFYNGAFYYSKEIVKNIIPQVDTDRNWVTLRVPDVCMDHSIVFIHNNLHPEYYDYLSRYKDLILVCGVEATCDKVKHLGRTIYLPLSVDVDYVKQFRTEKTRGTCYVGRKEKLRFGNIPTGIDCLCGLKREELLPRLAQCKKAYCVGRCAIEAKILNVRVLPFDRRYPDPKMWHVLDNKDAARTLQEKLDELGG